MATNVPGLDSVTSDIVATEPGVESVRVVPGTYSLWRSVFWWDDVEQEDYVRAALFSPQVSVTSDTEVVLDARKARKVDFRVPGQPTAQTYPGADLRIERTRWDGQLLISTSVALYVTPTERVDMGVFRVAFDRELTNAQVTATVQKPRRMDLHLESWEHADQGHAFGLDPYGRKGGWVPFPAGHHTLNLVDAGFGDPSDLAGRDLRGKLALVQWGDDRATGDGGIPDSVVWTDRIANVRRAGAVGVVLFPNAPVARHAAFTTPAVFTDHWSAADPQEFGIPTLEVKRSEGRRLLDMVRADRVTIDVRSDPNVRAIYHLDPAIDQRVPDNLQFTFDPPKDGEGSQRHQRGTTTDAGGVPQHRVEARNLFQPGISDGLHGPQV
jgi:hypothetical protein